MQQSVNITLSPEQAANDKLLKNEACAKAGVQPQRVKSSNVMMLSKIDSKVLSIVHSPCKCPVILA